jgi:hypothetical protein
MRSLILSLSVTTLAFAGPSLAQSITSMGTFATYNNFYVSGLSSNGSAASGWGTDGTTQRPFRWSSPGGIVNLGTVGPAYLSVATGISRDGQTVAANMFPFTMSGASHGFRWTQPTGWTDIGVSYVGGDWTDCNNISGDGLRLMGRTRQPGGEMRAYTWNTATGFSILPNLPGAFNSVALASSNTANYITGSMDFAGVSHPVRWGPSGIIDFFSLVSGIGPINYATGVAISDNGSRILGYALHTNGSRPMFMWYDIGGNGAVGFFSPLPGYGVANPADIATDGTAFVGSCTSGLPDTAFLWSNDLGMVNLNTWFPTVGVNLTGWQLLSATAISADGTAIAGTGKLNGVTVPYVVRDIPCLHKPQVYVDPYDADACVGTTSGFSVAGFGNFTGTYTYQWQRNGVPIFNGPTGNGSTFAGTQTANMSIVGTTLADAASYSCIISNPCGSVSTTPAQLTVIPLPYVNFLPATQYACNGSSATINYGVVNATTVTWQIGTPWNGWVNLNNGQYNDISGFSFFVSNANTPSITLSNIQNVGLLVFAQFRVEAGNACRSLRPSEPFQVLPDVAPSIITQSPDKNECYPTATTFTVIPTNFYPNTYQWQKYHPYLNTWYNLANGQLVELISNFSGVYSNVQGSQLSFTVQDVASHPFNAQYRCLVTNGCGTTTVSFNHTWDCPYTCPADFDASGGTPDNSDVNAFWAAWLNGDMCADVDCSGGVPDAADVQLFYDLWLAGGCDVPCPLCP